MAHASEAVRANREEILRLARAHGARQVRVFGSVARGEADETSDLDLLVDLDDDRTLLDLGGLWYDLNELLGLRVDVVTESGLREEARATVLREARPL